MEYLPKKLWLHKRLESMRRVRSEIDVVWRELAKQFLPRRARFFRDQGRRPTDAILNPDVINNTPLIAVRVLASGMMAAITSPSRRWFRMTTPDPDLLEAPNVRRYLHLREARVAWAFSLSNFYQALADGVYPDVGIWGTAAMLMDESPDRILACESWPIGEWFIATDAQGIVDETAREIPMTTWQIVDRFCRDGQLSRLSSRVKMCWEKGDYDTSHQVVHQLYPNEQYEQGSLSSKKKRIASVWYELAEPGEKYLLESGYDEFPVMAPRWATRGTEPYGYGPGGSNLNDALALQHQEKKLAMLVDKSASPPMRASSELRGQRGTLLPGDTTYLPPGQGHVFEPAMQVQPDAIRVLTDHIRRHEDRIDKGFFADLWLRVTMDERNQRATAREIEQGDQETMLQLGPVLERLTPELLQPAVERCDRILERRGFMPPPPKELDGIPVKAEFISVLHQAQKAVGLNSIRSLVQEVAFLVASGWPEAKDNLNPDIVARELSDILGTKPEMILSSDEVKELRAARAQREAAAQAQQTMLSAAKATKDLGTTPAAAPDNALGQVLNAMGPVAGQGVPGATWLPPGEA